MSQWSDFALPYPLFKRGKVRDVFEVGADLLIVSSDRISAFDYVLPSLVPDKGKVLNRLASFWFDLTREIVPNHIICAEPEKLDTLKAHAAILDKRAVLVKKLKPFPVEAVVRAYLVGSGWKTYQQSGEVCGIKLPAGLVFGQELPEPIFTPTTKAEQGHDENITFAELAGQLGAGVIASIRDLSLKLFAFASAYARTRGIIIADTKFEFGCAADGSIVLIDEIFTPDSSRFWRAGDYRPGQEPPSLDKQFVRSYLLGSNWDRQSVPPPLPAAIIEQTRAKYLEIFQILTGKAF